MVCLGAPFGLSVAAALVFAVASIWTAAAARHNVRRRRRVESVNAQLSQSEARFRIMLQRSANVVLTANVNGEVTFASPATARYLGLDPGEVIGSFVDDHVVRSDHGALAEVVNSSVCFRGRGVGTELRWKRSNGTTWPTETTVTCLLDNPALGEYILVVQDNEARGAYERALQARAERDPLTGLANRDLLRDIAHRHIGHGPVGVLLMDLDDFKNVNDTLGHSVGDELLCEVGRRLASAVGDRGTVGRLGGDEFAAIVLNVGSAEEAEIIGAEMTLAIRDIAIDGRLFRQCGSVGVAVDPESRLAFDELLLRADQAMYVAKASRRGGVARFDSRLQRANQERSQLERELAEAIDQGELVANFQPVVSLVNGLPTGAELLVRWNHPRLGLLPPARFLGMIDQLGMARDLEVEMIRQAATAMKRIRPLRLPGFRLAVNLSAVGLADIGLAQFVLGTVDETTLSSSELTIELTESALLDRLDDIADELTTLRARGIHIALDDFGTGFSSLAYLGRLPVDVLKLDRQFIIEAPAGSAQRRLLQGVVRLGLDMQLEILAEGIEDEGTETLVRGLGCGRAQGFYYSRPLEADALIGWLEQRQFAVLNGSDPATQTADPGRLWRPRVSSQGL